MTKRLLAGLACAMALTLANLTPSAPAFAEDIRIVIREGKHVIEDGLARSDNPWIDLSEGQVAQIIIGGVTETYYGPFHGRLEKARGNRRLAPKGEAVTAQLKRTYAKAPAQASNLPAGITAADLSLEITDRQCLTGQPLRLWRTDANSSDEVIVSKVGGKARKITFKPGDAFANWPQDVDISDSENSEYILIGLESSGITRKFSFVTLKGAKAGSIEALADNGCLAQARVAAELDARSAP